PGSAQCGPPIPGPTRRFPQLLDQGVVDEQPADIALALFHIVYHFGEPAGGPTDIVKNGKYLVAHLVDERPDALGWITLRRRLDHGKTPVEALPLAATDVQIGCAGDAEPLADHRDAVATYEGARLLVDSGHGI